MAAVIGCRALNLCIDLAPSGDSYPKSCFIFSLYCEHGDSYKANHV